MYSASVIKTNVKKYELRSGRKLTRRPVATCRAMVAKLDALIDPTTGELDKRKRPGGLLPIEKEFIRNEIVLCRLDFLYWCLRYVFVLDKYTRQPILFTPNKAQRIMISIWAMLEERGLAIAFLSVKARQLGVSTLSEIAIAHRIQFKPNINATIASSDPKKSEKMSRMMETCWNNQPWWLVPEMTSRRVGAFFEFGKHNSGVSIQHGTQFSGISRGETVNTVHASELVDYDNPEELIDASLINAAHESQDLFLALESTAKGRGNWLHKTWRESKEQWPKVLLYPVFLPWFVADDMYPAPTFLKRNPIPDDWVPAEHTTKCAEKAEFYVKHNPPIRKFLGDDWTMPREQMWWWECGYEAARRKNQLNVFLSETPGDDYDAFQSTNMSAFDADLIAKVRNRALTRTPFVFGFISESVPMRLYPDKRNILDGPPLSVRCQWNRAVPALNFDLVPLRFESYQEDPTNRLYVWEFPKAGEQYIVGVDTSDGIGKDRSVIQVIKLRDPFDPNSLDEQVAEFASAWVSSRDLWPLVMCVATYYSTPDAKGKIEQIRAVIECNGSGHLVQWELQKLGWWNFHPWKQYDNKKNVHYNKIGWVTNIRTRGMAVDTIVAALRDEWFIVNSPWFVYEMETFERDDSRQSLRASYDEHDDRVMPASFALTSAYIDEISSGGRAFFTSRKRPNDVPVVSGVRPSDLTAQLLKDLGKQSNNPYTVSGRYNPY